MNAQTIVRNNERSWAIQMITHIDFFVQKYDLVIKGAGGEPTISQKGKNSMFPDVILFNNTEHTSIVQGWELKMPDVPINDETFVKDAQRKARALNLTSTVIWNFTYAKFFVLNEETDIFEEVYKWENIHIKTRTDVETYKSDWESTLENVVLYVNKYLINNDVRKTTVNEFISKKAIHVLINENKKDVADFFIAKSATNAVMLAEINIWWNDVKFEYLFDELDKFKAYSKTVIINWAYRIIFAHLIIRYQKAASLVYDIDYDTSPLQANEIFAKISSKCDFYNVFEPIKWGDMLPNKTWNDLVGLSLFLKENGIKSVDQNMFQKILEYCIANTRRELNGQYTTPKILANILSRITIHDFTKHCSDPCCGTGTIPHEIIELKKKFPSISTADAINTTWASDKFKMPLQIANISMTSADTINLPNRLFQRNVFNLTPGIAIQIINPSNGKLEEHIVPKFGAICSNLPFVAFENLSEDDQTLIHRTLPNCKLSNKSDLCYYIALHLFNLLEDEGYLGIIISNSWLGTEAGNIFYSELIRKFSLKQVHISGKGRWFQNADVVTTLLLMQKTKPLNNKIQFYVWKKDLEAIATDTDLQDVIVNSSLTNHSINQEIVNVSEYCIQDIQELHNLNLSYNSLFHDVSWLLEFKDILCPLTTNFNVIRGSRRGWDKLFFPTDTNNIEDEFIIPALFNARRIDRLIAFPNRIAFCCSKSEDELERNYPGALNWINRFKDIKNGTGRNLTEVLATTRLKWYEMLPNEVVPLFTMMNPNDRFFFGRFVQPSFINQRLIGLSPKNENVDIELCHALLNTVLMKFFIEAVGFGRGLGVLDVNKDNIAKCYMLNPDLISDEDKEIIKEEFRNILNKRIVSVDEELADSDWIKYNMTVLKIYGIESYYEQIAKSLISLRNIRLTVME